MIDLVVIRHEGTDTAPYIFRAPEYTGLREGDLVEVETCKGTARGVVLDCCTVLEGSPEYRCLAQMAKMKPFKKVLKIYRFKDIEYTEDKTK